MILRERYTKTLASGASSWNTVSDLRGEIIQIVVNPSVSTTTYNIIITDDSGTDIVNKKGQRGIFVDDSKRGVYGIYTIGIQSASTSDNDFITTIIWEEKLRI